MSRVIFDISMSLDGFATASNVGPEELLGEGGCRGQRRRCDGWGGDRAVVQKGWPHRRDLDPLEKARKTER
jgi:hypothetical protein